MLKARRASIGFFLFALPLLPACGPRGDAAEGVTSTRSMSALLAGQGRGAGAADGPISHLVADETVVPFLVEVATEPWKGDFDGMVERGMIRALVNASTTAYFLDGPDQRGLTYDALKTFENQINDELGNKALKVHVVIIPTTRDRILADLLEGRGDMAASNLTITAGRQKKVQFTDPLATGVAEVVVTGPGSPPVEALEDLAGREIWVRRSSSYYESLQKLNGTLEDRGLDKVKIREADERLETEDLLEMVNAGLFPATVADDYLARFWAQIFQEIVPATGVPLREGGEIAWAFRKNSPQLERTLNRWVKNNKKGTLLGNMLIKRYLQDTSWAKKAFTDESLERYRDTIDLFERFAGDYSFETLMIVAQAYQESGLDQSKRSRAGAVGIMQLLPSTAADPNVGITNIHKVENNIHAGVRYLRFLYDRYFADEELDELDRIFFTFAAYNAGPRRVTQLRQKAAAMNLDPNVWFRNVEVVAARDIGRETVQYVSNIYKYYLAYQTLETRLRSREEARSSVSRQR